MEKKITKIEMFEQIKAHLTDADEIAFIEKQIELTRKKNTRKTTVDKNADLRSAILDVIAESDTPMACSSVVKAMDFEFNGLPLTTQKVSPQIRKLVEEGLVIETLDKKVKVFSVAE